MSLHCSLGSQVTFLYDSKACFQKEKKAFHMMPCKWAGHIYRGMRPGKALILISYTKSVV